MKFNQMSFDQKSLNLRLSNSAMMTNNFLPLLPGKEKEKKSIQLKKKFLAAASTSQSWHFENLQLVDRVSS